VIKRGDIILFSVGGDMSKPRPGIVVQSDQFRFLPAITVVPLTSDLENISSLRPIILPDDSNGLTLPSHAMIDKLITLSLTKVGRTIGVASQSIMNEISATLILFLELT
jgi:mRNA interferase MazF